MSGGRGGIDGGATDPLERHADVVASAVVRGGSAEALLEQVAERGGGSSAPSVQRDHGDGDLLAFNSTEHQRYGDDAARNAGRTQPYKRPTAAEEAGTSADLEQFALSHGDINMLTGDYFEPREVDKNGNPIPDSLFALMARPSASPSRAVGTRDELIFAIKDARPDDPRFSPGGVWAKLTFSDEVQAAVKNRYLQRAAHNYEHFAAPTGAKSGGPKSGDGTSAGGSFRALHEAAIKLAAAAKAKRESIDQALSLEAAAEHYLEDKYAADARAALGARPSSFTADEHLWTKQRRPKTLGEVETTVTRMIAIREWGGAWGGVTRAARPRFELATACRMCSRLPTLRTHVLLRSRASAPQLAGAARVRRCA